MRSIRQSRPRIAKRSAAMKPSSKAFRRRAVAMRVKRLTPA